jgi:hypothetical protein
MNETSQTRRTTSTEKTIMLTTRSTLGLALLGLLPALSVAQEKSAKTFPAEKITELHRLINPQANEARWEQVPWMPSNDIWAARKKAAEEGKPILLWYMAGEPLGTC